MAKPTEAQKRARMQERAARRDQRKAKALELRRAMIADAARQPMRSAGELAQEEAAAAAAQNEQLGTPAAGGGA